MKKSLILAVITFLVFTVSTDESRAAQWIHPIFALKQGFDDNVFLTDTDKKSDSVTTVLLGLGIEPELNRHELKVDYIADLQYFGKNTSQNTENHNVNAEATLHFNEWRVEFSDHFRYFENRAGSEDTARIPRTSNVTNVKVIYEFNKLDLGINYENRLEDYRSDNAIGSFNGRALTYQDLDSNENSGEVEAAFHFWPKTSVLFSSRYGTLVHDTGSKSDSDYFDILTGLRGELTAKGTIEGKIGYRNQNYDQNAGDFQSVIYHVSFVENFTERDILEIDIDRTTHDTTYKGNAYFKSTLVSGQYAHGFTDKVTGTVSGSYRLNKYPVATTEGTKTEKREDDFWRAGLGLSYELPKWGTVDLDYTYSQKASNFDTFDYNNNLVSLSATVEF